MTAAGRRPLTCVPPSADGGLVGPRAACRAQARATGGPQAGCLRDARRGEQLPDATPATALRGRCAIDCVLDVGANTGQFVDRLRGDVGYRGHIVSFEPAPASYAELTGSHGSDAGGAGSAVRWAGRLAPPSSTCSRPTARSTPCSARATSGATGSPRFASSPTSERVEVRRLDDVFDDAVRPLADPVTFLKLDTQGSDLEVLYGASGVLHRVGPRSSPSFRWCPSTRACHRSSTRSGTCRTWASRSRACSRSPARS